MFDQKPQDRISCFRRWRNSLPVEDTGELCKAVVDFWCQAPLSNQYYSADYNQNWPDPWEMLAEGVYDEVIIGLAMFYSLAMLENSCYNTELVVCEHDGELKLCTRVEQEFFLNFSWHEVVNTSQVLEQATIIRTYTKKDFEFLK